LRWRRSGTRAPDGSCQRADEPQNRKTPGHRISRAISRIPLDTTSRAVEIKIEGCAMPSVPHITCIGIFFAALLIPGTEAPAQTHRADYPAESSLASREAAPGLGAPVLNAPFSAEAVTTWRPNEPNERSEWRVRIRFYRDHEGRVR